MKSTSTPIFDGENVFVVTDNGFLVNIERKTGEIIYSTEILKILKKRKQKTYISGFILGSGKIYITTLNGQHYDFNYLGYLRYFDNCNEHDRLVINVKTDHGDYERWKDNEYIRKVFISYKDKF